MNAVSFNSSSQVRFGLQNAGQDYKILLVDDDIDYLDMTQLSLRMKAKHQGVRPTILTANGYEQALDTIEKNPDIDQVVSDWDYQDPQGRTGFSLAKTLMEKLRYPLDKILIWSGFDRQVEPFQFLLKDPKAVDTIVEKMLKALSAGNQQNMTN